MEIRNNSLRSNYRCASLPFLLQLETMLPEWKVLLWRLAMRGVFNATGHGALLPHNLQ